LLSRKAADAIRAEVFCSSATFKNIEAIPSIHANPDGEFKYGDPTL